MIEVLRNISRTLPAETQESDDAVYYTQEEITALFDADNTLEYQFFLCSECGLFSYPFYCCCCCPVRPFYNTAFLRCLGNTFLCWFIYTKNCSPFALSTRSTTSDHQAFLRSLQRREVPWRRRCSIGLYHWPRGVDTGKEGLHQRRRHR